ncbi:hypothetical protein BZA05DRAFT_266086 [Tricharina praecox]|uniref:uncharacterized protein n=1 Tax=Tricharina praecox TaxID=43433 RepID=UPI002220A217|nr:uncharacterized protein BZA05DRAFT_266086 [Tricharina praecox]KAI5854444.1 hypothetical protein BZA05DRAFT_266086 [Tricharina praecox]
MPCLGRVCYWAPISNLVRVICIREGEGTECPAAQHTSTIHALCVTVFLNTTPSLSLDLDLPTDRLSLNYAFFFLPFFFSATSFFCFPYISSRSGCCEEGSKETTPSIVTSVVVVALVPVTCFENSPHSFAQLNTRPLPRTPPVTSGTVFPARPHSLPDSSTILRPQVRGRPQPSALIHSRRYSPPLVASLNSACPSQFNASSPWEILKYLS